MKASIIWLCLLIVSTQGALAQEASQSVPARTPSEAEQQVIRLSRDKWIWMAERKLDSLESLFHEAAVFVHMGGNMTRSQELNVIKTGRIHYKQADIQDVSARILGSTAIVLSRIRLLAVVGGNEVTNPFMVTEVYVQQGGAWKLVQLSFSRLADQTGQAGGKSAERTGKVSDEPTGSAGPRRRPPQGAIGDFAPKLAQITDDVLYGDIWERPALSKRDRSLATVAALIALNRPDQLRSHFRVARQNGVTQEELIETITHLAFYAGWPNAVTAIGVAKEAFGQ